MREALAVSVSPGFVLTTALAMAPDWGAEAAPLGARAEDSGFCAVAGHNSEAAREPGTGHEASRTGLRVETSTATAVTDWADNCKEVAATTGTFPAKALVSLPGT